ncbi:MAG: hypothetical protein ACR2MG_13200 [Pyrinomonadaceae bacterium]
MKNLFRIILSIVLLSLGIYAQCETEPTIEKTGKVLRKLKTTNKEEQSSADYLLTLKASVKGASWQKKGAEAAVLTLFVDGRYNQDIVLFAGAEKFDYRVLLGKFPKGEHTLAVVLNDARSAQNAKNVRLFSADVIRAVQIKGDARDYAALVNSPILYARPNTIDKFSDIPLLIYYEIFPTGENTFKIRYTAIYSNEDGGTQTAALMARWGRATDIEWVYEVEFRDGAIASEIYQGANHETKTFNGKRAFGAHPLIFDVTVNNNFSDAGCSELRFAPLPIRADLSKKSRETVMDENAWTYRIMAQEAIREGRVNGAKLDANIIADPRDYLYAEIYSEPKTAAIALEAENSGGEKFSSDAGIAALRVSRNGFLRIAMRLPKNSAADFPKALSIGCYAVSDNSAPESVCQNLRLIKLVRLDRNYLPIFKNINAVSKNVKSGEKTVFALPR